jgi:hypothetical protein
MPVSDPGLTPGSAARLTRTISKVGPSLTLDGLRLAWVRDHWQSVSRPPRRRHTFMLGSDPGLTPGFRRSAQPPP